MQVQVLRGEKMEDIGTLAGQIGHELNAWMAALREHGDTPPGEVSGEVSFHKTIQHIHDACVRSINLSRQLLLFSDVVLPDEDGIRLAERLLALKPELPVLRRILDSRKARAESFGTQLRAETLRRRFRAYERQQWSQGRGDAHACFEHRS